MDRQVIDEDCIEFVSHWYDFAILELLTASGGQGAPGDISVRFGLSSDEVAESLERLKMTGYLKEEAGKWSVSLNDSYTEYPTPSVHIKNIHDRLLAKAREALYAQQMSERHFESYILAFNPEQLPAARRRIQEFVKSFNDEFSAGAGRSEVYALTAQFHRLTTPN